MTRITFRSPNYKNGKSITLKGSKLDDSKVYCNQCGVELTQKEIIPSVITFHKKETEGSKDIHTMRNRVNGDMNYDLSRKQGTAYQGYSALHSELH